MALYEAAEEGNLAKLNEAVEAGADIEYQSPKELRDNFWDSLGKNNTSLHVACFFGFIPIVLRLLELNAKVGSQNEVNLI